MLRCLIPLILALVAFATPPAQAQINWDIPETETPGGDGGGMTPGEEFYCMNCCSNAISDPTCCRDCGCQCNGLPNCVAHSSMSLANVPDAVNAYVLSSFADTREALTRSSRGKMLFEVLRSESPRISEIYKANPRLASRTGAALAKYWPHDMWTNTGRGAHEVAPEALRELRAIMEVIASEDRKMGGGALSKTIEAEVMPHLGKGLIGMPYHEAFQCFAEGKGCGN